MLDLLKDSCYRFLLSLVKKHLNEHVIYYNFSFFIEKVLETYQIYCTVLSLLNSVLFLSRFSVSLTCLPFSEGLLTSLFLTDFQC